MSWHYLPEQVGVSSGACCTGGEPLPPLKSRTTHAVFYSNGKLMESYLDSLSGTMCEPSTGDRGGVGSMWSRGDFLARTLVPLEKARGWRAKGRGSGRKWRGSYATLSPDMSSWKIAPCSPEEDLTSCSWTWPKWGIMLDGVCLEQMTPVPRTSENVSGLWPTPQHGDYKGANPKILAAVARHKAKGFHKQIGLRDAVVIGGTKTRPTYPTPTSSMMTSGDMEQARYAGSDPKRPSYQTAKYPTPCADDTGHRKQKYAQGGTPLLMRTGGQLNPDWVEWLMGWPIGWTDLKPLAMDKYLRWLDSHGILWAEHDRIR